MTTLETLLSSLLMLIPAITYVIGYDIGWKKALNVPKK